MSLRCSMQTSVVGIVFAGVQQVTGFIPVSAPGMHTIVGVAGTSSAIVKPGASAVPLPPVTLMRPFASLHKWAINPTVHTKYDSLSNRLIIY